MGFDDVAADAMALLAMEQYAMAVASLGESLTVAESRARIRRALEASEVPVWAPSRMVQKSASARRFLFPTRTRPTSPLHGT